MLKWNPKKIRKIFFALICLLLINTISYAEEDSDILVEKDIKDVKNLGPNYYANSPLEYLESRGWIFTYDDLVKKDGIYCIGRRRTFTKSLCCIFRIYKKEWKINFKRN